MCKISALNYQYLTSYCLLNNIGDYGYPKFDVTAIFQPFKMLNNF